jgi:hypothetical protein
MIHHTHIIIFIILLSFSAHAIETIKTTEQNTIQLYLLPEVTEGNNIITNNSVCLENPETTDKLINLSINHPKELSIPETVTIQNNHTCADFDIFVIDDTLLDGTQIVKIMASGLNINAVIKEIKVHDNEKANLSIKLPETVNENAGYSPNAGYISVDKNVDNYVPVYLYSSLPNQISIPTFVVIQKNTKEAFFSLNFLDDYLLNGNRKIKITATVAGWQEADAEILIKDDEKPVLILTLQTIISENDGILYDAGSISISGIKKTDVIVSLSTNINDIVIPETILIPAGCMFKSFDIITVNNNKFDDSRQLIISATADNFISADATITLLDDEIYPDIDHNGLINIKDVIILLQFLTSVHSELGTNLDINQDDFSGLQELIFVLKYISK